MNKVLALFVSDIHLSHNAPIWRSNESNWYEAQARPLRELKSLQEKYDCPIFCAGDVFDKWSVVPECINFAIDNLPYMHCIPGQHDLPDHNLKDIHRSAYWTLVKSCTLCHLPDYAVQDFDWSNKFQVHAFPYGVKISPFDDKHDRIQIALIHRYSWIPKCNYDGARSSDLVSKDRKEFKGYDWIVAGDNHRWFEAETISGRFWNSGCFIRRHANEKDYYPSVGLLMDNGGMDYHDLDTSQDKYIESEKAIETEEMDLQELIASLSKLGDAKADFVQKVEQVMRKHGTSESVQRIMAKAMGI